MGIDWTDDRTHLAEAIPPAYTRHIGAALLLRIAGDSHADRGEQLAII